MMVSHDRVTYRKAHTKSSYFGTGKGREQGVLNIRRDTIAAVDHLDIDGLVTV